MLPATQFECENSYTGRDNWWRFPKALAARKASSPAPKTGRGPSGRSLREGVSWAMDLRLELPSSINLTLGCSSGLIREAGLDVRKRVRLDALQFDHILRVSC